MLPGTLLFWHCLRLIGARPGSQNLAGSHDTAVRDHRRATVVTILGQGRIPKAPQHEQAHPNRMKVPQYSEAEIRCVLQYRHYYKSARLEKLARPVKKNEQQSSWTKPSIRAAAGSGFSPGPFAPLMGIQGMVTRTGRDGETWGANQRISV